MNVRGAPVAAAALQLFLYARHFIFIACEKFKFHDGCLEYLAGNTLLRVVQGSSPLECIVFSHAVLIIDFYVDTQALTSFVDCSCSVNI